MSNFVEKIQEEMKRSRDEKDKQLLEVIEIAKENDPEMYAKLRKRAQQEIDKRENLINRYGSKQVQAKILDDCYNK